MDQIFKALGDANRRKLLDCLLWGDGLTARELCAECESLSRQAVGKHLGVLERAKLVKVKWRGRKRAYFLNLDTIHEISWRWLDKYEKAWIEKAMRR